MLFLRLLFLLLLFNGSSAQSPAIMPWNTVPDLTPMPAADDSGFAPVNGIRLYYAIFHPGGQKPVLLLHGGLTSSDYWSNEVTLLSPTHEVIVVDNRDQGRSSLSPAPLHYELMADDVLKLLDHLHLRKVFIVGWSDGGIMGLILAMRHPERVDKLFTYGTNFSRSGEKDSPPDSALSTRFRAQALANYRRIAPAPDSFPAMTRELFTLYKKEPELDTNALKQIKVPTLIAYGQYEQFYTAEHFATLARLIPYARLLELPNMSHGGPRQDPVAFHKAVIQWLEN